MEQKLKKLISKILNMDISKFKDTDISPNNISDWDSLNHLSIVTAVEEEFGVELDVDEIVQMTEGYCTILNVLKSHGIC